jgi:hypothetical protein
VVELPIDPAFHQPLDVREIGHHIAPIELVGAHVDLGDGIVPVRVLANAVVIEQPMAVTEFDALGD